MGSKHHTVIVVPHAHARFRKWRVTNRQLLLGGGLVLACIVGSLLTTVAFFSNEVDRHQIARLTEENESLREVNRAFEESVRDLKNQLTLFEDQTRKLAIVAGLDGTTIDQQAGIGGAITAVEPYLLPGLGERADTVHSDLERVEAILDTRSERLDATPAIAPVKGVLTSGFGHRRDPVTGRRAMHQGIDIATAPGQPVAAAAGGMVVKAERTGGLGNAVYISHGYGVVTRYGHLSSISVEAGTRVERGDIIGAVGNTGRSTGYHLHYEVRVDGQAENPLSYILDGVS